MADKIDALFDDLQSRGFAKDKTREDFRNYMLAPGTQGYQNRKDFFDDFKGQGLTDLGTYEDFAQLIGLRGVRRNQQQSAAKPVQAPSMDFAPLDTKQANRRMMGRGAVPFDQQDTESEQPDNNIRRIVNGNLTPKEQQRAQKRMQQRMDEIAYEGETGNRMRQPVKDIQFEAPAIERDEFGNVRRDENGNPLVGFTTDENAVSEHRDIMAEQDEWDSLSPDEKRRRAREAKLRAEEIDYTEPTLWDTISKKTKSSIIRKGAELVDFMQQMTSGMYVEDPSSPTGYTRTATYEEQRKNKKDPLTRMSDYLHDEADVLSRQGEPLQGRDFLDLLWDGEIGAAMQKGVGVALESLPMTLSAYNPVTMAMNGILMASGNYRQELLDNPDIPAPKRFAMAVGSAAIEQIVEKYSDPVFKYVGGSKILKGFAKEGAEEIAKDVTKKATETLAQRIFRGLGGLAKDAAGEATEEIITDFGNDALGELLDLASGDKDYGIRAQWEQMKRENPNVSLKDFAWQKAKEYINDGIAGGMAGAYTSGTTQASVKGLQFALGNKASAEDITRNPGARIDPVTMEVAQSYDDGYTETEPDLMKRYNDEAQASAADLPQYGKEFAKMVMESESPVETMDYLMQNRNYFTDEQIAAASDFYQKMSRVSGVMDGALDRIDQEVENENAKVRYNTHQQTGSVITAQVGDRPCYITGGDVVTDEATGMPVLVGTGGAVVVRDAQTGVTSVHSPQEVRVTSMTNADEMQQYNETVLRQQLMQQADEDIAFGSPANEVYQLEDTVTLNDGEGNTITGEIVGMPNSIDGVYQVQTNDTNEPMKYLTADELNRRIATHNGMEVQRGQQIADEGQTIENQQLEQTETESVPTVSNQEQPQPQPAESGTDQATGEESAPAEDGGQESNQPQSALSRIPVATDEKGQPIMKKGRPQYQWHKASVEDAAAALIETTGGDKVMARDNANRLVKTAQAKLEKIRKQEPKGEDPLELAESSMEIKRAEDEVQATIKQWRDVASSIQKQMDAESEQLRQETEAKKSEEQRQREAEEARLREEKQREIDRQRILEAIERDREKRTREYQPLVDARKEMEGDNEALAILNDTEPRSLEEHVSSMIRPHSMLWQDASESETGLQSELGLKRGDMQRMMSLLGNKESGAKPFGKVVLDIYEGLPEAMKDMYTDEDVRNTLLNLFGEGNSTRMMHLTEENRIAEARETMLENLRRDAEAENEAWAEAYHLTPEEHETFEDFMSQDPALPNEQEFINQIIEDEEQNQRGQTVALDNTSGTAGRESEGGEEQIQGQSSAETAGADQEEPEPEQGAETPAGGQTVSGDNVPGGEQKPAIAPSEQLKPTDLRDAVRPESAELGVNEANARARYQLSTTEKDAEGNSFYEKDGSIDLWNRPELFTKAGRQSAPIRLTSRNLQHILDEHHKEIGSEQDVFDFLDDIFNNAPVLRRARGRGMFVVVEQDNTDKAAIIKLMPSKTGDYYNVETAGYYRKDKWKEYEDVIADLREPGQSDAAADVSKPQIPNENGREPINAETQASSSEGKDTNNSSNLQEKSEKSSEKSAKEPKRLVSDSRMEELKKIFRDKIGGQLNVGVDPELLAAGAEMAVGYLERGITKFADFAKAMIEEVGDFMRPYLKSFYNAVRDMPEAQGYADQMDDYETVRQFDVHNFDKGGKVPDAITKAQQVADEQKVSRQTKKIKQQHPNLFAGDLFGEQEGNTSSAAKIAAEEDKVDTNPSEAQKEAGNYQKGHIKIDGYDITIENPKGSVRRGVDANGKPWETEMHNTYGYIRGTEGVDGDHIDVFLSDDPTSGNVYVVDQVNPETGDFDEHKVLLSFGSEEEAREAYLSNYEKGWKGLGNITEVSREDLRKWIDSSHRKTKPFAEYSMVKNNKQTILKKLGDLQDNGKQYEENKPVAYELGQQFAGTLPNGTTSKEALRLASEALDANKAKGGVYALPFFDGVTDAIKVEPSEQLKPTDLRDSIKPDTAEMGSAEAKAKAKHLQSVNDLLDKHLKKYRTLAPVEIIDVDSEETDQSLKDTKDPVAFDPETKKILIFANNIDEDYFEEGLFHESVHRGLQQYYGDEPIELADAFWETQSPDKPEVTKRQKETISKEYAHKPEDIKEEYFVHLLSHHMKKGSVDKILSRLSPEHQEIVNNILHNIGYDTAEETKRRAREEANTSGSPENSEKSEDGRGVTSSTDKIEDVGEEIAGARKDLSRKIAQSLDSATKQTLGELPFSKAYKKPDLKKAIEEGALRESDAVFYDAFFSSFVDQNKPRVSKTEERRKKYNPAYRTDLEKWVDSTHQALQALKDFVEADEQQRDRIIESLLADRYPFREKELTELEKRKEWNKDRKDLQWGEKTTPNPLWVTYEVMKRLDYTPGDKLDIPFGILKADTTGTQYSLYNKKDEHNYYASPKTVEEGIDAIVWLARLKRGDSDIQHPVYSFYTVPTKSEMAENGKYRVIWGGFRNIQSRDFDSKEDAEAFASTKKTSTNIMPLKEVVRRFGYKIMFRNPLTGERYTVNDKEFDTDAEAKQYLEENYDEVNSDLNGVLSAQQKEKENTGKKELTPDDMVYTAMVRNKDGKYTYGVLIDKKYANNYGMPLIIKDGFATRNEAKDFAEKAKEEVFKAYQEYKAKQKAFVYFDTGADSRIGEDYRGGKDVTAEDFMNTFGFRGVQFGNWTNQADRQMAVNQAYDAFLDLAKLIGVSPKAISLNGELGIAFGARGSGNFAAHYEPGEIVINLTKTMGAGSLAHEWWHALDNYFARSAGERGGMVTDDRNLNMRQQLRDAFNAMLEQVAKSPYYSRSKNKGDYWGRMHEVTARLLAEWVDQELKKRGELNTFLSRGAKTEGTMKINYDRYKTHAELAGKEVMPFEEYKKLDEAMSGSPYPSPQEVDRFSDAMRNIFDVMQERIDDETGNVALYHKVSGTEAATPDSRETALRDQLIDVMKDAGIDVITDNTEGQQVLDETNGKAKESKVYHGSGSEFDAFDHSHMGEGEGSQAFGWGTYVTDSKGIGKSYARSGRGKYLYKGKNWDKLWHDEHDAETMAALDVMELMESNIPFDEAVARAKNDNERSAESLKDDPQYQNSYNHYLERIEALDNIKEKDFSRKKNVLYDVEIPDDTGTNYIDWQKPLSSEQTEKLKDGLAANETFREANRKLYDEAAKTMDGLPDFEEWNQSRAAVFAATGRANGDRLYKDLSDAFRSQETASKVLNEIGFTGIKYPAGTIMGGGNGATNYVIFNENDAKITKRTKFFRTKDGQAYGYTYNGKIYIDPSIATSETPIHEYTHLWAEALRQKDPETWKQIVEVLKNDEAVKPFWDKVTQQYPELTDDNDISEEVLAQYSGRRGAERLREVADEVARENKGVFGKAQAVEALRRMKNILTRFWKAVADMMGWKFTSADEVADEVLYDLLSGVKPNADGRTALVEQERQKPFHDMIDEMFDNPDFDKSAHSRERYDLGDTPEFMKKVGITGDNFSLSFKNIKSHQNKDSDHSLTKEEWHVLPDAIKKPFLITRRKDADDKFRLYINISHNGHPVAVGVDVKRVNQGKDKPMLEVNSIKTVFGQKGKLSGNEEIVTYDEKMTPEQEALLRDLDYREYPSIQELSGGKDTKKSDTLQGKSEKSSSPALKMSKVDDGRPRYQEGENALDYAERLEEYERQKKMGSPNEEPVNMARQIYEDAIRDTGERMMIPSMLASIFNKETRERFKHKFAESWFDYSRSIKAMQDGIEKATGNAIQSFEEVWRTLNAKSSIDNDQIQKVMHNLIEPLSEFVGDMVKDKEIDGHRMTIDDVEKYMNAVHGIERNFGMAMKQAKDEYEEDTAQLRQQLESGELSGKERKSVEDTLLIKEARYNGIKDYMDNEVVSKWYSQWKRSLENAKRNRTISDDEYIKAKEKMEAEYEQGWKYKYRTKDYSGLTALFADEFKDEKGNPTEDLLEQAAKDYAEKFEKIVGKKSADGLWQRVKALNEWSLRKSYESGLISKDQYNDTLSMYKHYVPLRGWHDDYAGDVYQYISRGEPAEVLQGVLKKAYGRKSRAARILGTMAAMANTAIVQGNKNLVAQHLLNMAMNHKDAGLLMPSEQYYQKNADGQMIPQMPALRDDMTPDEMRQELERFEAEMKAREKAGEVQTLRSKFKKEFPLHMAKWQEQRHAVRVMRNGKEYMVYILGDPRAAEAFNGLLNPNSQPGAISNIVNKWNRWLAKWQTSLSPEFLFSNFQRDVTTATTGAYIKFGNDYKRQFENNILSVMPLTKATLKKLKGEEARNLGGIFSLFRKYDSGTLDMNDETERMFKEFIEGGGMTGISHVTKAEEYQESMEKMVRRMRRGKMDNVRKGWKAIGDGIEFLNKGIENATRFATYMTSRQHGRSIRESIFDAKEASVNFNMKGSGAWGNMMARRLYLYVNPAMQALRMLGTWYENDPVVATKEGGKMAAKTVGKRFLKTAAGVVTASVTCAIVNMLLSELLHGDDGDDDDKDKGDWWALSEWNRYNYINVINPFGKGYLHWSIPQELRPLWAMGQIAVDMAYGRKTWQRGLQSTVLQLNNLSPLSFFEGGTDGGETVIESELRTMTPSFLAPFFDAYFWNRDFMGHKITNRSGFNKEDPEWKRAGDDTPKVVVNASRKLNEITGGADNSRGWLEDNILGGTTNPSALYYLATQQFGGIGSMAKRLFNLVDQATDDEKEIELRNIPFVSKVYVSTGDDHSKQRVLNDKFWMYYKEYKGADHELSKNKKDVEAKEMTQEYADKRIEERKADGTYNTWKIFEDNDFDYLFDKLRGTKDEDNVKRMVVDAIENGKMPDYEKMLNDPNRNADNDGLFYKVRMRQIEHKVDDMKSEEAFAEFDKAEDPRMRKQLAKRISKDAGASEDPYGDKPSSDHAYQYQLQRTAEDVREDAMLYALQEKMRDDDRSREKDELSKKRRQVHSPVEYLHGGKSDAVVWDNIRKNRKRLLDEYGLLKKEK